MQANTIRTWVLVVLLAALVVGLIAFGRGRQHSRGDELGATPTYSVDVMPTDPQRDRRPR
jgi:hypothetical protein